jgi:hypothetical protein
MMSLVKFFLRRLLTNKRWTFAGRYPITRFLLMHRVSI